ncbi:MAG: hypothetical protein N4A49_00165 [Marinifilaceae bacterium]|jgi:hypothetical protein|nr:hypothetical protein [Marinifilaceae bacterium]
MKIKLLVLVIMLCLDVSAQISKVKLHEIIEKSDGFMFTNEYLEIINHNQYNEIRTKNYHIIHIPYKTDETNSDDRFSLLILFSNKNLETPIFLTHYYYSLSLIDFNNDILMSNNLICNLRGQCTRFIEIVKLYENKVKILREFKGYDNSMYIQSLHTTDNYIELNKHLYKNICVDTDVIYKKGVFTIFKINTKLIKFNNDDFETAEKEITKQIILKDILNE